MDFKASVQVQSHDDLLPSCTPTSSMSSSDKSSVHSKENEATPSVDIADMTEAEKKALYRKIDWHLLPMLAVLFTMSFVDRGNIGNALSLGMVHDLRLDIGVRANLVTAIFYIAYAMFEVPSQVMLKLTRPSKWIPGVMMAWGIVMTLSCLVKNYKTLFVCRFFLGMTEAGIVPGTMFYLSLWYPRAQLGRRAAYMLSTAAVGLAWGGILAYGINKLSGRGGLKGWAWIFAIEGIITCVMAAVGLIWMHDYPDTATFLTEKERAQITEILREDAKGVPKTFEWKYLVSALKDWKVYFLTAIYLGVLTTTFDIALFLPTIIKDIGFGAANAQLLLVPPHTLGWPITVAVSMLSDRVNMRGPFLMVFSVIGMIGFGILRSPQGSGAVGYVGTFFATIGTAVCIPISITWIGTNAGGEMKRAATLGIVLGTGSLGGIISSFTFRTKDSPHYYLGHGVALGMLGVIFVASGILSFTYWRLNKAKEERCRRENIDDSRAHEFSEMNDDSPLFRYTI
ncbi:major facilitator superfamily domain-containing protein [Mycena floridula]|nr:major facilitator superfamily domain-containing protein [Mycena floridula]